MSSIQIRDVDPALIEQLKDSARDNRRSLSQQILQVLHEHVEARQKAQVGMAGLAAHLRRTSPADNPWLDFDIPARTIEDQRSDQLAATLEEND